MVVGMDTEYLIERFVTANQSTNLSSQSTYINRQSGMSIRFSSNAIDSIIAAGWANRLGTSLFRLKYGLDSTEYQNSLIEFQRIAIEAAHLLEWPDDELTAFMAEFVLDAWLLDRQLWVKEEWLERAVILRELLKDEERKTATRMIDALR